MGTDWVNLASHLGIADSDISLIKQECPGNAAQQARSMLRLWIHTHGNRASGRSLDAALIRMGRAEVAQKCIFNEPVRSSLRKEELGTLRSDERDITKVSESMEELMQTDRLQSRDEKKYEAEEKEIEEKKTVKERKQEIERRLSQEKQYSETQRRSLSIEADKIPKPKVVKTAEFIEVEVASASEEERPVSVREKISQFQEIAQKETKTSENILISQKVEERDQVAEFLEQETKDAKRRDSELFEGVSESLGRIGTTTETSKGWFWFFVWFYDYKNGFVVSDELSPIVAKTPPPSPADFLVKGKI